ncbi:MAG: COQ9 family protein [Parvularculales bacterium]
MGSSDYIRRGLVEEMLHHVPFDGWSRVALERATTAQSMDSGAVKLAFPGGMGQIIAFFSKMGDERMAQTIEADVEWASYKVRERITRAVRYRLEADALHRDEVRRAMSLLLLPAYSGQALTMMYRTVDAIWQLCGDTSADFNFYTKRAILAGVFGATLTVWLGDESEHFADTWCFLDRRIADVMRFERVKSDVRRTLDKVPNPFVILARLRYPF